MEKTGKNTCIEYGYRVPIQLCPHTQALEAALLTDSDERLAHGQDRDQSQQTRSPQQADGSQSKSSVWIAPPACLALREQGKQLQQQKHGKLRQGIVLDASPSRFEVPDELQAHERSAFDGRTCQLIGASPISSQLLANSLRREPDGAVQVPLRMVASLLIRSGAACGADEMSQGQRPGHFEEPPGPIAGVHQQQIQVARQAGPIDVPFLAEAPAGPSSARSPSCENACTGAPPSSSGAAAPATQHGPRHRYHTSQAHGHQQPILLPATGFHRRAHSLSAATGSLPSLAPLAMESTRQEQLMGRVQGVLPQHHHHHHHPAPCQGEAEEDDDGAMLIEVGSADRSAEGALLPTPDRPRVAGAGSGWDALRGLGLGRLGGLGGDTEGGEVAGAGAAGPITDTLAMLSPFASTQRIETSGGVTTAVPVGPQQQNVLFRAFDLAGGEQGMGFPEVRQRNQLSSLPQAEQRSPQKLLLPTEVGAGNADEGFDADDEAETAESTERALATYRLSGRPPSLPFQRPLPGVSAPPPWASAAHAAHASGLASFSSLAQALPVLLPTPFSAALHRTASALPGVSAPTRLEADPALSELLKLKCSLRRAVQGDNSQAVGLILSLLGALPATPELLAASQVAAVVEPLQQSNCAQVATAARQAIGVWKAVLKAAARRPASAGGHPGEPNAAGEPADGGGGGIAGPSHPHHSSHRLQRGSSLPHAGLHNLAQSGPRGLDVSMRDRVDPIPRPMASAREGRQQPHGSHISFSHARSRSDMLAEGLLAACQLGDHSGPSGTQPRSPRADLQGTRLASREGLTAYDGVAWVTESRGRGTQLGKQDKGGKDNGCSRGGGRASSPSESRTVTEGETGGRSSSEGTSEEGHAASQPGTTTCDGGVPCGKQVERSGGGSGSYSGATHSCSPLSAPTAAAAPNGGAGGSTDAMPSTYLSPDTRTVLTSHVTWPPTAAGTHQPHPLRPETLTGTTRQGNTAVASQAHRVLEHSGMGLSSTPGCGTGSGAVLFSTMQSPWRHIGAAAAGFPPAHEGAVSEVLSMAIPPLTPAVVAGGPQGPLMLASLGLPQPSNRKRKGDYSGSRRRSLNPSKRIASPGGPGLFQGLRASLPASLSGDAAGGVSDDQRHLHGPVAGIKTPSRTSLLGLHAPLSKRQRHHASGSGGHGAGGGQPTTATQVRRMSLLLSSLDLGHGGAVQASAESEGDADADADMGSQDDGAAAMLTSDDDAMPTAVPCTNNAAASPSPDTEAGGGTGTEVMMEVRTYMHAATDFQNGNNVNGDSTSSMMHALARQRPVPFGARSDGAVSVRTEQVGESEEEGVLLISTGLAQEAQVVNEGGIVMEQVSIAGCAATRHCQLTPPPQVPPSGAASRRDESSGNYPFVANAVGAATRTDS